MRIRATTAAERPLERVPVWGIVLLFAAAAVLLFREFVFSDLMLVGQDTFALGYAARAFFSEALRSTGYPLWNPQILGGTPFLESLAGGDSLYPPSLLLLQLTETYRALGWKLVLHVFLAGCFMYGWIRVLGGSKGAALVSGIAYLLAPYMVTLVYPGHDGKLFVTALTPLLFAVVELFLARGRLVWGAATGAVVALVILTTHFQMAYFLFGTVGLYAAFRTIQKGRREQVWSGAIRRFGLFLAFSTVGAGAAGIQLLPAVGYVTEHSRRTLTTTDSDPAEARAYSSSWSLHPEEAVSLVVPEFVGNNAGGAPWATGTYWGRNPFKLNHEYLGLAALLLALVAFLGGPNRGLRWFLAATGGAALFFALGAHTPVWRLLYEVLPGISLFRAPSMAVFVTGFAVATTAGLGVDRGLELVHRGSGRRILRLFALPFALLVAGTVLSLSGFLPGLWSAFTGWVPTGPAAEGLEAVRPHMTRGFALAALTVAAIAATWWAAGRGFLGANGAVAVLVLAVAVDEARVDDAFIQTLEFEAFAAADPIAELLRDRARTEPPFRVLSLAGGGQDVSLAMHGLELAAGHHPNDLARYRELIGMAGSGLPLNLTPPFHPNVARILNVRYLLWPDRDYGPLEAFAGPDPLTLVERLQFADGSPYSTLYEYPGLPRARLVGEALVVGEAEVLDVVLDPARYDPATQVVLSEAPPLDLEGPGLTGSVEWIEKTPNRTTLDVEVSGAGLLVIADNWFPGWTAYVDGVESPVLRADHTLRAVPVRGGRHRVEFRYASDLLRASLAVSILCGLILAAVAASHLRRNPDLTPAIRGPKGAR